MRVASAASCYYTYRLRYYFRETVTRAPPSAWRRRRRPSLYTTRTSADRGSRPPRRGNTLSLAMVRARDHTVHTRSGARVSRGKLVGVRGPVHSRRAYAPRDVVTTRTLRAAGGQRRGRDGDGALRCRRRSQ